MKRLLLPLLPILALAFAIDADGAPSPTKGGDIRAAITKALEANDPKGKYKGQTWNDWQSDTAFDANWLVQTPGPALWGANPVPNWVSSANPSGCTGHCNPSLQMVTCDANSGGTAECLPTQTTCTPMMASITVPGTAPAPLCASGADQVVDVLYGAIANAQSTVDITTLLPPDGRFLLGVSNALTYLAATGRPVTVRILVGSLFMHPPILPDMVAGALTQASKVTGSQLSVYFGKMYVGSSSTPTGWNHSKLLITDGTTMMTGGENWESADYLGPDPTFDLSVRVTGKVAADATKFTNTLWTSLCKNNSHIPSDSLLYQAKSNSLGSLSTSRGCLSTFPITTNKANGTVQAMGVGRLGNMDTSATQSSTALIAMIGAATSTVYISQQNIQGPSMLGIHDWPTDFLDALSQSLLNNVDIYIVQSSDGAGSSVSGYSNGTLKGLADKMKSNLSGQKGAPKNSSDVNKLLCKHLYLAQIRFTDNQTAFPDKKAIPNHAKVIAVDDSTFYVGSQNIYPPNSNMEYGIIISDGNQFSDFKQNYWDQLWKYSQQSAISGGALAGCYFK